MIPGVLTLIPRFVMINIYNPQGKVILTNDYFAGLVGNAITSCYGVAGMSVAGAKDGVRAVLFGSDIPEKGVVVTEDDGQLVIDLHIKVIYGVNIATIVENIKDYPYSSYNEYLSGAVITNTEFVLDMIKKKQEVNLNI